MKTVRIQLGERSYEIYVGQALPALGKTMKQYHFNARTLVVTDRAVGKHYARAVVESLTASGCQVALEEVPAGESSKSLREAERLFSVCARQALERKSPIVALGGGVIGDLVGFVAATYLRGLPLVMVPTTLLAQVDSAIGGKVAVNLAEGKNLVGAFYQPAMVFTDPATLLTLPEREFVSGLAEIIKYGVIMDVNYFKYLESNMPAILGRDAAALEYLIIQACQYKGRIVEADEHEAAQRAFLNFGHTIGHALEAATSYARYLHGEAVAIGMVCAGRIACDLRMLDAKDLERMRRLIVAAGLPDRFDRSIPSEAIFEHLQWDKKVQDGRMRFILPQNIGRVVVRESVKPELIRRVLEESRSE